MIVLQILLIPFVVLLLLGGVFMIGSTDLSHTRHPSNADPSITNSNEPEAELRSGSSLPAAPLVKF